MTARMTRRQALAGAGFAVAGLLAGCRPVTLPPPHATTDALPTATPVPTAPPREAEPEKTVDPELRRKLAQLVMTGFRGLTLEADNPIVAAVRDLGIGGVVLFSFDVALLSPVRNIESPEQVAALNAGLRELAETPLLIAADQEGGWVARLNEAHGFPATLFTRS